MPNDPKNNDSTSSIVMRAIDATTFTELQAFTKDLESRPVERLLQDVADLVRPSASKAQIVSYVFATKFPSRRRGRAAQHPGESRNDARIARTRRATRARQLHH